jgi:hypothetical protein
VPWVYAIVCYKEELVISHHLVANDNMKHVWLPEKLAGIPVVRELSFLRAEYVGKRILMAEESKTEGL